MLAQRQAGRSAPSGTHGSALLPAAAYEPVRDGMDLLLVTSAQPAQAARRPPRTRQGLDLTPYTRHDIVEQRRTGVGRVRVAVKCPRLSHYSHSNPKVVHASASV
jgi:hypothetical protein